MTAATYYDSAEGVTITRDRAFHEVVVVHNHIVEVWPEFLAEMGDHPEYDAQAVLDWLGY